MCETHQSSPSWEGSRTDPNPPQPLGGGLSFPSDECRASLSRVPFMDLSYNSKSTCAGGCLEYAAEVASRQGGPAEMVLENL